jgi:hypothetical protein
MQNPLLRLIAAAALATLPIVATPANAGSAVGNWLRAVDTQYPWCALYSGWNSATNCGFMTRAQCLATISGVGGSCYENLAYLAAVRSVRSRKAHRKRH